jgi:hypothetical protein
VDFASLVQASRRSGLILSKSIILVILERFNLKSSRNNAEKPGLKLLTWSGYAGSPVQSGFPCAQGIFVVFCHKVQNPSKINVYFQYISKAFPAPFRSEFC